MRKPEIPYFYLSPAILVLCLFVATVAHAGEGGGRRQAWVEPGVDRPGSDFKIPRLPGGPRAGETEGLPAGPTEQALTPGTPGGKPEIPIEIIPVTGSGKRDVAGMNFTAAPPKAAEAARIGLPGIPFPAADGGTGRGEGEGVDLASGRPATTLRAGSPP